MILFSVKNLYFSSVNKLKLETKAMDKLFFTTLFFSLAYSIMNLTTGQFANGYPP